MAATLFGVPSTTSAAPAAPENPFTTISNVKSPGIDKRLTDLLDQFDKLREASSTAIGDYTNALKSATPRLTSFVNADINTLGKVANGSVDAELADIRGRRKEALNKSVSRAQGDLTRILGLGRVGMGGGGRALGSSSYLSRLALDKAADIEAKAAADAADQERQDYGYATGLKLGTVGQRSGYLDALAGRALLPYNQQASQYGQQLQQLSALLQQALANNFYGLQKPYGVDTSNVAL